MRSGKWIGYRTDAEYDETDKLQKFGAPAAYIRKSFFIRKAVESAVLECTALGIYVAFVNGREAESCLEPGFTDYGKRLYYQSYDVTGMLLGGENVIGACLGDGWYTGNIAMAGRQIFGGYPLKLKMCLRLCYRDGTQETISTDESWQATTGSVRENDILNGERRDLRLPHKEIFTVKYDGALFPVETFEISVSAEKEKCERVKRCERLVPEVTERKENLVRLDFKQNFAGVMSVTVRGTCGQKIVLRHAEMINEDGTLYTENYRSAQSRDEVILAGGGEESYMPAFTYHGFRYGELSSDAPFELIEAAGVAIHNDLKRTGSFGCSHPLINKIYENVLWSQRSNFVSIPTDCPQRDERLGWTADMHLFSTTAIYNMDCRKFYRKALRDIADATEESGVPDCVPDIRFFWKNNAGWADAAIILPYVCYQMYGDKSFVTESFPTMKKHIRASLAVTKDNVRGESRFNDWLSVDDETSPEVFATAYLYYSLRLYAEMAEVAGENAEEERARMKEIGDSFREKFTDGTGRIASDTQTAYAMAYTFGLMTGEEVKPHLKRKLEERGIHLSTGFNGCRYLLPTLSRLGMDEYAYTLLLNKDYPSWGYSIENGATTVWERWNSYTKQKGFGDAGMNSFNHYSFGSCVEWIYAYMLGIRPAKPGFSQVYINPRFDPLKRVTSASGSYESRHGKISVEWTLRRDGYEIFVGAPEKSEILFDFGDRRIKDYAYRENVHRFVLDAEENSFCVNMKGTGFSMRAGQREYAKP